MTTSVSLPDGEVRIFEPIDPDLGRMYVLDVLGCNLLIRQRLDGMFVHIDQDANSTLPTGDSHLIVEVANGGENHYGGNDDDE